MPKAKADGARSGGHNCGGGSVQRHLPASGVLSPGVDYRPSYQAQKYQGDSGVLTEALGRPELYRRRGHGEVGGGAETKRAVRAVLGSSGVLGYTGRRVMSLRSKIRGHLRTIRTGGVKLWRRGDLTGLEIRTIPARRG